MRKISVSNVLKMGEKEKWALTVVDDNNSGDVLFIDVGNKRHEKMCLLMKKIAELAQEELNEKDIAAMQGL